MVGVDAAQAPVGGHDLDREHAVGGQAVLAGEPAHAAAEAVADHADVGRGAGQRGEAVLGRGLGDLEPQRAGGDAGAAALDVDLHAAHARRCSAGSCPRVQPSGPALWPVPWGATRRPCRRA